MRTVRIGLVGTGFGKRVMLPAFAACEGAKLAAVCSGRLANAQSAAEAFGIPAHYDDFDTMLERESLDLVAITTPPHLHLPMTRQALARGVAVLCEKPTALNLGEAQQMLALAEKAGVLHLIDHELRFHPTVRRLKCLVGEGYLGAPASVSWTIQWNYPIVLERDWNWWFDARAGGGLLGALGSHQIDLVRWVFGAEFCAVGGVLHNFLDKRPDAQTKELKRVTTDNYCAFSGELDNGARGAFVLDATARFASQRDSWTLCFHGETGSLCLDGEARLWALRGSEKTEETQPVARVAGLPEGMFPGGFASFSREIVKALRADKTHVPEAASFQDGIQVQAVLDAIRRASEERRWVDLRG